MLKLRFLSSYVITIVVTMAAVGLLIGIIALNKMTETVELTTVKLIDYENRINIPYVNLKLDEYKKQMATLKLDIPSKAEAVDIVIAYAEDLRQRFDAKAQTARPSENNGIVSLQMSFTGNFKSSSEFLSFLQTIINSNSPVVTVVSVKIIEDQQLKHRATFELKLEEPYMEQLYVK